MNRIELVGPRRHAVSGGIRASHVVLGIALALACLLSGSFARGGVEPWNEPAFASEAAALYRAVSALPVEEGHDALIVLEEGKYEFDAEGRAAYTHRLIYRVLTAAGVEGWSNVTANWEPWHQERPVIRARVVTPSGSVHWLDAATLAESGTDGGEPNVFTDRRRLSGPLPAIEPGAVVEEETVIRETQPFFGGGVVHRFYFGGQAPTHSSRLTIELPASQPLRHVVHLLPGVEPRRSEAKGRVRTVFESGPLAPVEDVEKLAPPEVPRWPAVAFSTGRSWQEVAARYHAMIEKQIAGANVSSLMGDAQKKARLEKVVALVANLHEEIRYTGVEYGEASIVPRAPAETLERKYGDCKDKAALLIAMLRAADQPAYLALLDTGEYERTDAALPGLGAFNHAIVYAPGTPDLWIDATSEFTRVGQLPIGNQGRLALVIRPETTELMRTPESTSADNRTLEIREFFLSEFGAARVVETTEVTGAIEDSYRDYYGELEAKEAREQFETYVKSAYLAESLKGYQQTGGRDFSSPFRLRLEIAKAQRGSTGQVDAAVGIPVSGLVQRVPDWKPDEGGEEQSGEGKEKTNQKEPVRRTHDVFLNEPFQTEWRYRIVPPPGFVARPLPEDKELKWGPATLTQRFALAPEGVVSATLRFDTGKRRLTPEEAEALSAGVEELRKQEYLLITFEMMGEAHLAAGRIREALAEFRKLVAQHPKEAQHHGQVARALLAAGIGEAAHSQARLAVQVEPDSARAHQGLGWVLQHDGVGRRFGKGYDREASAAAYRKALEIEPDNVEMRADLAILLEHNLYGRRYESGAKLDEAIAEYRKIEDKLIGGAGENNLPIALMWAGRFSEMLEAAKRLKGDAGKRQFTLVARAALEGAEAALQEAARIPDAGARRTALANAGTNLLHIRRYPEAIALMRAGAEGTERAAAVTQFTAMVQRIKRHEDEVVAEPEPASLLRRMFLILMRPEAQLEEFLDLASTHAREQMPSGLDNLKSMQQAGNSLRNNPSGFPMPVVLDMVLALVEFSAEGDDESAYRLTMQMPAAAHDTGRSSFTLYAVREDGKLRIFDSEQEDTGGVMLGLRALELAEQGKLAAARRLLDWARQDRPLNAGDDPLAGPPFARFWERGAEDDLQAIRYAAASLMRKYKPAERALPILREGRAKAASDEARLRFDLAEAGILRNRNRHEELQEIATCLLAAYPRSATAFQHLTAALMGLKRWSDVEAEIAKRLERLPDDPDALRARVRLAQVFRQWTKAAEASQQLAKLGEATAEDLRLQAWNALMADAVTPEAIQTAQRATMMAKKDEEKVAPLHTVATLYAETGQATEARTVLLQGMSAEGLDEPDGKSWYVFGRIAEHFGEFEAAAKAYRRVESASESDTLALYHVAKRRLDLLVKNQRIAASQQNLEK